MFITCFSYVSTGCDSSGVDLGEVLLTIGFGVQLQLLT